MWINGKPTLVALGMLAASLAVAGAQLGCEPSYRDQRPPMDELDSRDRGLQSKDVLAASDQMAMDLLASPELNASREQWTLVVGDVEDLTTGNDFRGSYVSFIERLRVKLQQEGRGRVRLIENRRRFHEMRGREREGAGGWDDEFGQGGGDSPSRGGRAVQPAYILYGKAMDLPGRGTTYYNLQFDVTDMRTREQVWSGMYEVRVGRK